MKDNYAPESLDREGWVRMNKNILTILAPESSREGSEDGCEHVVIFIFK